MFLFFFNDTATTEIYTLSLHDALPISVDEHAQRRQAGTGDTVDAVVPGDAAEQGGGRGVQPGGDREDPRRGVGEARSGEHTSEIQYANISYAVFCFKKKKKKHILFCLY